MSTTPKRSKKSYRPNMGDLLLEERIVMSGATAQISMLRAGMGGRAQPGAGDLNARQLMNIYRQQFREVQTGLQQYVNQQVSTLYDAANLGADGRPTRQALADFSSNVAGALNATTLGLSAQASLLPGSGRRLIPGIQESFLGAQANSLASRIAGQVDSGRAVASRRMFQNMLDRQIRSTFANDSAMVASQLRSPFLNRLSVDPTTGQRLPLSQYVRNQAAQQINNTFGSLANSVGPNARAALFDSTGAFNAQAVNAFQRQYGNALNTAAFQVNSVLAVVPGSSDIRSQLQSGFFGTGDGTGTGVTNPNFLNSFSSAFPTDPGTGGAPFTASDFDTAFQNGFTTAFQNFTGPVNNLLNISAQSTLPTGFFQSGTAFPSLFGTQLTGSAFNNGFNNGFLTTGTGFPGFGTAPTGFNPAFGTGFNSLITNFNGLSGITVPSFTGTGIGTGTGTGVVDPVTGIVDPTGGIGTGTGTGTGTGVIDPTLGTGTTPGNVGVGTNPGDAGSGLGGSFI